MELTEINSYARQHFQLLLSWYTFFLAVNFTVIGWFTGLLLTSSLKTSQPIVYITTFFLVQIFLSYLTCLEARKYFDATYNRCNDILNLLWVQPTNSLLQPKPAIPINLYSKIITLMRCTFATLGFFWMALLAVTIYLVPL